MNSLNIDIENDGDWQIKTYIQYIYIYIYIYYKWAQHRLTRCKKPQSIQGVYKAAKASQPKKENQKTHQPLIGS